MRPRAAGEKASDLAQRRAPLSSTWSAAAAAPIGAPGEKMISTAGKIFYSLWALFGGFRKRPTADCLAANLLGLVWPALSNPTSTVVPHRAGRGERGRRRGGGPRTRPRSIGRDGNRLCLPEAPQGLRPCAQVHGPALGHPLRDHAEPRDDGVNPPVATLHAACPPHHPASAMRAPCDGRGACVCGVAAPARLCGHLPAPRSSCFLARSLVSQSRAHLQLLHPPSLYACILHACPQRICRAQPHGRSNSMHSRAFRARGEYRTVRTPQSISVPP